MPTNPDSKLEAVQRAIEHLPDDVQQAAIRSGLTANLQVLSAVLAHGGAPSVLAWDAYRQIEESGSVDPFDMDEIVCAVLPSLERSLHAAWLRDVEERLLGEETVEALARWMDDAATSLGGTAEAAKRDPETRDAGFAMEGEAAAFRAAAQMVRAGEPPQEGREE